MRALVRREARLAMGPVLCALALGTIWALSVPAFWPVDELSHVPYARAVVQGDLPTIHTPIPDADIAELPGIRERLAFERAAGHRDRMDVWTSNHPPLYYGLAGVPLLLGDVLGAPGPGLLGARAIAVLAAALGVAATFALARLLVPGRRRLAVAAAAFAALTPTLSHFSGLVFNDSLSFASCTVLLVAVCAVLRSPSWANAALVGVASTAAALTRASALPLVALAAGACAVAAWRGGSATTSTAATSTGGSPATGAPWRAALTGIAWGTIATVLPLLGAGWFYLRNWQRYGDLTATRSLLMKFDRDPNAELAELLLGWRHHVDQWDRLFSDLSTGVWFEGWRLLPIRTLGALVLVGLVLGGWRRWRARRAGAPDRDDAGQRPRHGASWHTWAWCVGLAFLASLVLATARFHAQGGSAHARYLLPALGLIAVVSVVALAELDRWTAGWATIAGLSAQLLVGLGVWVEFLQRGREVWVEDGVVYPLLLIDGVWRRPLLGLAFALLVVGLTLVLRLLVDPGTGRPATAAPSGAGARA